jgi:hypothetical protein
MVFVQNGAINFGNDLFFTASENEYREHKVVQH